MSSKLKAQGSKDKIIGKRKKVRGERERLKSKGMEHRAQGRDKNSEGGRGAEYIVNQNSPGPAQTFSLRIKQTFVCVCLRVSAVNFKN
jgi:hypothetical protein